MNSELLNQIKEQTVLLSAIEKQELANFLAEQLSDKESNKKQNNETSAFKANILREAERKWIEKNRSRFAGQWVALEDENLLNHGIDGRKVYAEARLKSVQTPFVVHLESSDELPFGGW